MSGPPASGKLIVPAGLDAVTRRHRQVSRVFRGNLRDTKHARAELLTEVSKGRHAGPAAKIEHLYVDWIVELRRKGRPPKRNICPTLGGVAVRKVTTKMLTDRYGERCAGRADAR